MSIQKRRQFLQWGIAGVGAMLLARTAKAAAPKCEVTARQPEGPFYPGEANIVPINDLTRVEGASQPAEGQVIYVRGVVRSTTCQPVANANVEIWQACASGRYNHAGDPNSAPLDPNFRYWGETFTNAKGEYEFKSILPGAYPAAEDWDRPPHIHFRIAKLGYEDLITQMYFKGEELNDLDLILQRVPARMRDHVIVDFQPLPTEPSAKVGYFDISIVPLVF